MSTLEKTSENTNWQNRNLNNSTQTMLINGLRKKETIKETLDWSFWNKKINIEVYPLEWSNKVIINIHGTYWGMYWWNNKYKNLAEDLQNNGVWNVVIFETSRKWIEKDWSYEKKVEDFEWKTFDNELSDCKNVIQYILDNSLELFWVNSDKLEITINGNSLWWILALALAHDFPQIKNISTVWTGMLTKDKKNLPLLEEYPENDTIKNWVSSYNGNLLLQYWTQDSLFKKEDFQELKSELKSAKKVWIIKMVWVDHTFKYINWEISNVPYKQVETNIGELVKWNVPSGEIIPNPHYSPDPENDDLDFFI